MEIDKIFIYIDNYNFRARKESIEKPFEFEISKTSILTLLNALYLLRKEIVLLLRNEEFIDWNRMQDKFTDKEGNVIITYP
ncbi:MAG: hypothetical protein JW982_09170 [Spirochaetes bacterium]|nr:hypothetical protein [Spirochaetota bacterium]